MVKKCLLSDRVGNHAEVTKNLCLKKDFSFMSIIKLLFSFYQQHSAFYKHV